MGLLFRATALLVLLGCGQEAAAPAASAPSEAPAEAKPEPPPEPKPTEPAITVSGVGFDKPESVLHDPEADVYLVSNVIGKALEKDRKAFISRLGPDGEVQELKWIEGGRDGVTLHAPKGMALSGDALYVTDIDVVRVFDRKTGKPRKPIAIKDASSLNGISAAPDGTLYVSDTGVEQWGPYVEPNGKDAVYRLSGDKAEALARGKELGNPNGLAADASGVWVVNKPGELFRVEQGGSQGARTKLPKGGLDGVVQTPAGLIISSWDAKAVLRQTDSGFETVLGGIAAPAGIGFDAKRGRLLIPNLNQHTLVIRPL